MKRQKIIAVSGRGQITIPSSIRQKIKSGYFICTEKNGKIILEPLLTKEEYLEEVKEKKNFWGKHGGLTLDEAIKNE